jgi:acyl-CoA reductase-like NAD-dependent aldehyde dehydrogenase
MSETLFPAQIPHQIDGTSTPALNGQWVDKFDPHTGQPLAQLARGTSGDVARAVEAARLAQPAWANVPPVQRGLLLLEIVKLLQARKEEIAAIVAQETGKSVKDALGEVGAAAQCGLFYAGEGQRLFGRTTTSGQANKYNMTIRQPIGVAGLIIAANTPIANVAWKVFPALICGNGVVLKAAEDTPATSWIFGELAREAGLPNGVLNIVQGLGHEAGAALADHPDVGVLSFTGSTRVGKLVGEACARRLAKCSLELGGKNALVVCDDADLDHAAAWIAATGYSNAGQRCAAGSRVIVFASVYNELRDRILAKTAAQKVGNTDTDDFGPVINKRQLDNMTAAVQRAVAEGATLLTGGTPLDRPGYYMAPTVLENIAPAAEISRTELFGPIVCLYKTENFETALALANDSPYGLTACIHTRNFSRAHEFVQRVKSGVAVVNAGCHGSEPHMPFGGVKWSGNGTREPGTEALDIYSDLKDVYLNTQLNQL